jgi:hypothetical protein
MHEDTENKQRLADYRMERAVWSDANWGKEPKENPFEHLGGKCVLQPIAQPDGEQPSKPIDFSHIGGRCIFPAPTSSDDSAKTG